jgi:hypothetical protein
VVVQWYNGGVLAESFSRFTFACNRSYLQIVSAFRLMLRYSGVRVVSRLSITFA